MNKIALSLGAIVALSSFAVAQSDTTSMYATADESTYYVAVGLSGVSAKGVQAEGDISDVKSGQDRLGNVTLLAGYNINRYFAVEGRYSTSFTHEDKVEMDNLSIFAKPQYPISEDLSLYALLGYGAVTFDGINETSVDVDESGFQWGVGLSYEVANNISIFVDYTSLASDMDGVYFDGSLAVDAYAYSAGVSYKF